MPVEPVLTDRTDIVACTPGHMWAVLEGVPSYPSFWPWLRSFDGRRLAPGEEWHGTIAASGLLRLHVTIHLDQVDAERCVTARVGGDLSGTARLDLVPDGPGGDDTALRLTAALVPHRRSLRALTRWARPLAQASHDRVIHRAVTQLTDHLTTR